MKNRIIILLISMLPFVELRGSIPYAQFLKMNLLESYIISIVGNILVIPIIYFIIKEILLIGSKIKYVDRLCLYCIDKGYSFGKRLENKVGIGAYITIFLFVAIPIPGTGVWTATIASSLLNLDFKKVFIANLLGVIVAGSIITLLLYGILNFR